MRRREFLGVLGSAAAAWPLAAHAQPAGPSAGYKIEPEFTRTSPDGAITIEQYLNKDADDYKWQFWVRRQDTFTLLDPEPADYPTGFLFTRDRKWVVRGQKTGSGESTLYLYRLAPQGNVSASRKPLGDLAWAFLKTRPDWRKIAKKPEYHESAGLLEGLEENYRSFGVDWPMNRYLLITLSADADVKGRKPMQTSVVHGWRCRYDLQTAAGTFFRSQCESCRAQVAGGLLTIATFGLERTPARLQMTLIIARGTRRLGLCLAHRTTVSLVNGIANKESF